MSYYKALSDIELMGFVQVRDHGAFTELYDRYGELIYVHAFKMLGNEEEAEDVVQELFISIWSKAPELALKANLAGYLYIATRHKVLNKIRRQKNNDQFMDALAGYIEQHEHSIIEQIHEKELTEFMDQEITRLPFKMRQVFEMSRKQHLSYKEIAISLGISDKTVKKQINNAIKILKLRHQFLKSILLSLFYIF